MSFSTLQGETIIIDGALLLTLMLKILIIIAQFMLGATVYFIVLEFLYIPILVRRYILAVSSLSILGNALVFTMLLSDAPANPYIQWSAYTIYMNLLLGTTIIELELLKIFIVASGDIDHSWIGRLQSRYAAIATLAYTGHYISALATRDKFGIIDAVFV